MKRTVSLPALVAHAASAPASGVSTPLVNDPRTIHAPFFTTIFVLSPLLWPIGIVMGVVYLCNSHWRAAGAAMLSLGLTAAVLSSLVFLSVR